MGKKHQKPFRPADKVSRLTFTEEERADPVFEKPLKKAEKAADKLEQVHDKIPKKKIIAAERTVNADTGKKTVRLYFEETDKSKPASKLSHAVKSIPQRELLNKIRKEIREGEQDNVGVESAHKSEQAVEFGVRRIQSAYRSHKLKPYRQLAKAEKQTIKAETNYLYHKSLRDDPHIASNPISRWQQKKAIKKEYISSRYGKSAKTAQKTAENTKTAAGKATMATDKLSQLIVRHKKGILIILGIAAVLILLMGAVSSCFMMFEGGLNSILGTSYTSEDGDIVAADNAYTELENALQHRIDNIENESPGYDEYRYDLDEIGHDPHVLASYLTALLQYYRANEVDGELQRVFDLQYELTITETVEVRYRTETRTDTWTDEAGNSHSDTYTVEVPYDYYILNVGLKNSTINSVANNLLTVEQFEMYRVYFETKGNKSLLFGGGTTNSTPSTDLSGVRFENGTRSGNQNLVDIATSPEGNVGGQPYWSWYGFNSRVEWCACFVSWCLNQAGYSEPRFAACQSQGVPWFKEHGQWASGNYKDLAPGDVIFF